MAIVITTNDGATQKQETFTDKAEVFKNNTVQAEPETAKPEKETKESVAKENNEDNTDKSLDYFNESNDDVEDSDDVLDTDEDETETEDDEVEKPKKNGFKKRIDKLTKEKSELKAELERLKAEKSGNNSNSTNKETPKEPVKELVKPNLNDFEQYDEYLEALSDYKIAKAIQEREKSEEVNKVQKEAEKILATYSERLEEAKKFYGEERWNKTTGVDLPLTPVMREFILDSEIGPHVTFYLSNNPDECKALAKLSPISQAKKLAQIELKLENKIPKKGEAQAETKVSKAPEPVKPISSKTDGKTAKDPSKMDFKEFKAWRNSQKK